ncbi:16 kDa calcium-binding protein-like isoform X2 [Pomacea canaliculata]|uniref:16 kDa calcium-binding protein-like isoform X2 n=1 Tax=Pomacea canaliculata TaxID=400727 RepID=UPI000D73B8D5|nr:16 kDa calcium-binding protein-like isoform X2 [Pomacea canaliculata]XP_025090675.1 16 kDa calcium-binding protein-like isoform X2 [Pomacea canaliculata]
MGSKFGKLRKAKKKRRNMTPADPGVYYRAEFTSVGDVLKDGMLNKAEFLRLIGLLGVSDPEEAEVLWDRQTKAAGDWMSSAEYVALMSNPVVAETTSMWRKLFAKFDTDGSGYASQKEVISGLADMGIPVNDAMKKKIKDMDTDKDGRIFYGEFLKMQLLNK